MPQYENHDFLTGLGLNHPAYRSVFTLVARKDGLTFPIGSACLIAPELLVTAKHILHHVKTKVAKVYFDEDSPDVKESEEGPDWSIKPTDVEGIEAFRIHEDGRKQIFGVKGYIQIGLKHTDLMVLHIVPHPGYQQAGDTEWHSLALDLVPPKAKSEIIGYGYPDHPEHKLTHPEPFLPDHFIYQSTGEVLQVNLEPNMRNFQTSMLTESGMSGGPVFVKRGEDHVFAGVISRGGKSWSAIAPLWQLAFAETSPLKRYPGKNGKLRFADLILDGTIQSKGKEQIELYEKSDGKIWCKFLEDHLLKEGY